MKRFGRIRRITDDSGMSIIEMMVAVTLFMGILVAVLSSLDSGAKAERGQEARHSAMLELRQAMTQLTKDLRQTVLLDPDSTHSRLEIKTLISGAEQDVVYWLEPSGGGKLELRRQIGASPASTLVTNMDPTDPSFCYSYDSIGLVCTDLGHPPAVPTAIRITLAKDPESNPGEPITLATDVQLRNL
jgi:type II secretory pathway pseudopilin PulG